MIAETIRYIRSSDEPVKTVLIGGFFSYYGVFFVLPMVFVMGYFIRVLRGATADESLPKFGRWRELFVDGVKAYAIWLVYLCIPFLNAFLLGGFDVYDGVEGYQGYELFAAFLVAISGGGIFAVFIPFGGRAFFEDLGASEPQEAGWGAVDAIGTEQLIAHIGADPYTYVLLVLVWYVLPAALLNFARNRTFAAGFDLGEIRSIVVDKRYLIAWIPFISLWWLGFLAAFSWQLSVVEQGPTVDLAVVVFEQYGLYGLANEVGQNLVVLMSVIYFSTLALAYAVLGVVYRSLDSHDEERDLRD